MLRIAGQVFCVDLVVFDKDGTLLSFDALWRAWFEEMFRALSAQIALDEAIQQGMAENLGYDRKSGAWDPLGPLTLASTGDVSVLMAGQLYQHGRVDWDTALTIVAKARQQARQAVLARNVIHPIGDVRRVLSGLVERGITLGLATTDDRESTEHALEHLQLGAYFAAVVCGDDGIPLKPAPDMVLSICRRLGIAPERAIMVGDTIADMLMARRAGCAGAVAVASGALPADALAPYADVVIPDIHAIETISTTQERA
jgi:phosphoglycolate phosphatase